MLPSLSARVNSGAFEFGSKSTVGNRESSKSVYGTASRILEGRWLRPSSHASPRVNSGAFGFSPEPIMGLAQPRYLNPKPDKKSTRLRSNRLNHLARGIPACHSYLEIGLREGYTFQDVAARSRVGVDPEPRFEFRKRLPAGVKILQDTSDNFFATTRERFDLVFLDGLHEIQQTLRDVLNALEILNDGGLIVVDDSVPIDEFSAIPDQSEALSRRFQSGSDRRDWNGDVFKAVAFLAPRRTDVGLLTLWSEDDSVQHGQTIVWPATTSDCV